MNPLADKLARKEKNGCPCCWGTPCTPRCTCAMPLSSTGCSRCCRYGSDDQRRARAAHIAGVFAAVAALPEVREAGDRDGCEFCLGHKGGVAGNENRIRGHVVCDFCTAMLMKMGYGISAPPPPASVAPKGPAMTAHEITGTEQRIIAMHPDLIAAADRAPVAGSGETESKFYRQNTVKWDYCVEVRGDEVFFVYDDGRPKEKCYHIIPSDVRRIVGNGDWVEVAAPAAGDAPPDLTAKYQELRDAVVRVVSQRGDDLCWRDVYTDLAKLVDVDPTPHLIADPEKMLANCCRFVHSLRTGGEYKPVYVEEAGTSDQFCPSGTLIGDAGATTPPRQAGASGRYFVDEGRVSTVKDRNREGWSLVPGGSRRAHVIANALNAYDAAARLAESQGGSEPQKG